MPRPRPIPAILTILTILTILAIVSSLVSGALPGAPGAAHAGQAAPGADIAPSPIEQRGTLPPRAVQRYVRLQLPRLRACYERELGRRPRLTLQLVARFTIEPTGHVLEEPALATSVALGALERGLRRCISGVLRTVRFPAVYDRRQDGSHTLGRRTAVRYGFRFKPAQRRRLLAMAPTEHRGVVPGPQVKRLRHPAPLHTPTPHTLPPVPPLPPLPPLPPASAPTATPARPATAPARVPVLPLPRGDDPIDGLPR